MLVTKITQIICWCSDPKCFCLNRIAFLTGRTWWWQPLVVYAVNFFSTSALTSYFDPIDVSAASKNQHFYGMVLKSMVWFCLLRTNSIWWHRLRLADTRDDKTDTISYYPYSKRCSHSLGTTVAFIDNSGSNARMFEMSTSVVIQNQLLLNSQNQYLEFNK